MSQLAPIFLVFLFPASHVSSSFHPQSDTELANAVNEWWNDPASARSAYGEMDTWNVLSITNMVALFAEFSDFNEPIANWATNNVLDMSLMFRNASNFNQPIGSWNTGRVVNMSLMFFDAPFDQPIGTWNSADVTDMSGMFYFPEAVSGCVHTNGIALDVDGDNCREYEVSWCGLYDDADFTSNDVCCQCGGGLVHSDTSFNQAIGNWNILRVTSVASMFRNCINFNQAIGDWNTGSATSMEYMFSSAIDFNQLIDTWITSSVTSMTHMFHAASTYNQKVSEWNIGKVTSIASIFSGAWVFNKPLTNWNVCRVTSIASLFKDASAFDQPVAHWNTVGVTTMEHAFASASVFNHPVGAWNTGMVNSMAYTFSSAQLFNQPCGSWNTGGVTTMAYMFYYLPLFDYPVGDWNTGDVSTMVGMFSIALKFNQAIGSWNTATATDISNLFGGMNSASDFESFSIFNQPIGDWNTGSAITMAYMLSEVYDFNYGIGDWNTGSVTSMQSMFSRAHAFNQHIGDWNTGSVLTMETMFDEAYAFNHPIHTWDTGRVLSMKGMFTLADSFNQLVADCNTASVTNMADMFYQAGGFNQAVGSWDTSSVTTMEYMFAFATAFNQPIGKWRTGSVTNMAYMFHSANVFSQRLDDWNTSSVTNMKAMFSRAAVFNQAIDSWNTGRVIDMEDIFHMAFGFCQPLASWKESRNYTAAFLSLPASGSVCQACDLYFSNCSACTQTSCLQCGSSNYLLQGSCLNRCPSQYYFPYDSRPTGRICQDCEPSCIRCHNQTVCLECADTKYLYDSKCFYFCPPGTVARGLESTGRYCLTCEDHCVSCLDETTCSMCTDYMYLYNADCFNECPEGSTPFGSSLTGRSCEPCEDNCAFCSDVSTCTICQEKYLHNGDCLDVCPGGTFANASDTFGSSCEPCGKYCSSCVDASLCLLCGDSKYLHNAACLDSCPSGTSSTGSGSLGLSCVAHRDCRFGFIANEKGKCELGWPLFIGMIATPLVILILLLFVYVQHRVLIGLRLAMQSNKEQIIAASLKRSESVFISKHNAAVQAGRKQLKILKGKYTNYDALLEILDRGETSGEMKLIRGSWLGATRNIQRLKRQQELPTEAFWSPNELRSQLTVVSIVAISYCWLHPVNPDPQSKHLRDLQSAIQLRLKLKGPGQIQDLAIFLDYLSIPQHGELGDSEDPVLGSRRTEREEEAFFRGLGNVNIPYASQLTEVWMMKWVPEDEPRKYMMRGWPFFEQAVSCLIKASTMLIEIKTDVLYHESWIDVHEKGKVGRKPPLIPSLFKEELVDKSFTDCVSDFEFVQRKYEETFKDVVGTATALWFVELGWDDGDAEVFSEVLQYASALERLLLAHNEITQHGVRKILEGCARCPTLRHVDLSSNRVDGDSCEALRRAWFFLGKPPQELRLETFKGHDGGASGSAELEDHGDDSEHAEACSKPTVLGNSLLGELTETFALRKVLIDL